MNAMTAGKAEVHSWFHGLVQRRHLLYMRFDNITGGSHGHPEMTMSVLIRVIQPDGDGVIVQLPLKCNYKG